MSFHPTRGVEDHTNHDVQGISSINTAAPAARKDLLLPEQAFLSPAVLIKFLQAICFSVALICAQAAGSSVNAAVLDIAGEKRVGTLHAVSNTVASIPGVVGVKLTAWLKVRYGWGSVMMSIALLKFLATVVWCRWGSAKRIS